MKKILLVDDEESVLELISATLAYGDGYQFVLARDGEEALKTARRDKPDLILLDNMTVEQMRESVRFIGGRAMTEASGGVSLESVRAVAETGVDLISVGKLTHSVQAADISLDFEPA